jgi:hypothetical protein
MPYCIMRTFLPDFRTFLRHIAQRQVRLTAVHGHIRIRHLKELATSFEGKEPFHPLRENAHFTVHSQRDERRIDFMDILATELDLLRRSEFGYLLPGPKWKDFMESAPIQQQEAIRSAYWNMDWNRLYLWTEVVDTLVERRKDIQEILQECPKSERLNLSERFQKHFPSPEILMGFFWVVIRPLEYLDAAASFFEQDAEGFYYPAAFTLHIGCQAPSV